MIVQRLLFGCVSIVLGTRPCLLGVPNRQDVVEPSSTPANDRGFCAIRSQRDEQEREAWVRE